MKGSEGSRVRGSRGLSTRLRKHDVLERERGAVTREAQLPADVQKALEAVARFYDGRQVGDVGAMGFRRSTELANLLPCLDRLLSEGMLVPGKTRFLDMGCADGRVNVFLSYLVRQSAGIELDDWILDDAAPLRNDLERALAREGLPLPPGNVHLFVGDSTDERLHKSVQKETGTPFEAFDLYYTYLTMQEEFAELIARKAGKGAIFAVYGLERIQPRFSGLCLRTPGRALNGVLALYEKT